MGNVNLFKKIKRGQASTRGDARRNNTKYEEPGDCRKDMDTLIELGRTKMLAPRKYYKKDRDVGLFK